MWGTPYRRTDASIRGIQEAVPVGLYCFAIHRFGVDGRGTTPCVLFLKSPVMKIQDTFISFFEAG